MLFAKRVDFLLRNRTLRLQIAFAANQHDVDVAARVALDFGEPALRVAQRLRVAQVKAHHNAVRAAIVRRCNCAETLYSRIRLFVSSLNQLKISDKSLQSDKKHEKLTSCPDVSQSCNLTSLSFISIVRILKSTPIVEMNDSVNVSSAKRSNKLD